jgi:hypothetical protein
MLFVGSPLDRNLILREATIPRGRWEGITAVDKAPDT